MIEIDPALLAREQMSHLLNGLIVPRPIAWVSTLSAAGRRNLAPHSYFNAVSGSPPIVQFSSTHSSAFDPAGYKDTLRNAQATGEFVLNLVTQDLLAAMNATSVECPPEVDEFELAQLESHPSVKVRPPRVARARAALECRVHKLLPIGDATVVFGEVVHVHVAEEAWVAGRVDVQRLMPMGRLSGSDYAPVHEIVKLRRPLWSDLAASAAPGKAGVSG